VFAVRVEETEGTGPRAEQIELACHWQEVSGAVFLPLWIVCRCSDSLKRDMGEEGGEALSCSQERETRERVRERMDEEEMVVLLVLLAQMI